MTPTRTNRKQQIIRAAKELFAKHGFKGTTTKMLAAKVGVSEATLYKYFTSKEDIYYALLEEKLQNIESYLPTSQKTSIRKTLEEIVVNFLEKNTDDVSFTKICLFAALEQNAYSKNFVQKLRKKLFTHLDKLFENWISEKKIKELEPDLLAKLFFGLLFYTLLLRTIFHDEKFSQYNLQYLAQHIADIFLTGVLNETT
ncbi:MAG: TetR/AcrR family transcriptional regulator [Desulfonauticus sp.]|nr:TetR/AcrR family transcriptional regulator [Desulfonauticus sp.]